MFIARLDRVAAKDGVRKWLTGWRARVLGSLSFIAMQVIVSLSAYGLNELDLEKSATLRWEVWIAGWGFIGATLVPKPPAALFGGALGIASGLIIGVFASTAHWANTGQLFDDGAVFYLGTMTGTPCTAIFWCGFFLLKGAAVKTRRASSDAGSGMLKFLAALFGLITAVIALIIKYDMVVRIGPKVVQ